MRRRHHPPLPVETEIHKEPVTSVPPVDAITGELTKEHAELTERKKVSAPVSSKTSDKEETVIMTVLLPGNLYDNVIAEARFNRNNGRREKFSASVIYKRLADVPFDPDKEYTFIENVGNKMKSEHLKLSAVPKSVYQNVVKEMEYNIENHLCNDTLTAVVIRRLLLTMYKPSVPQ